MWKENYEVYGTRKCWKQLRREGHDVGRDWVARLMRELGISGVVPGKVKRTTRPDPRAARPPDLVNRNFGATRPNALWVSDFTYVPTWSGTVYVAFVVDIYSRFIVGWRAATTMRTEWVLDALEMAIWRRQELLDGLVCHSDAGSQPGFKGSSQRRCVRRIVIGAGRDRRRSSHPSSLRPNSPSLHRTQGGSPQPDEAVFGGTVR